VAYRHIWLTTAMVGLQALMACSAGNDSPIGPRSASEIPQGAASVAYEVLQQASSEISSIPDRRRIVIRDEAEWTAFWDDLTATIVPQPDPPAVDFSTRMVIAATMGQRTSGGYTISVEEVAEKDGTLYAAVQEVTPGVLCITTDVMTAPAVAVRVPRHVGTVAFVDTELALPCAP
jgi:hypothetical protein